MADSRLLKQASWRPAATDCWSNCPSFAQWPPRVAVVAYGAYADYGSESVIMTNRMVRGSVSKMPVASPRELLDWACANKVRITKYYSSCNHCCVTLWSCYALVSTNHRLFRLRLCQSKYANRSNRLRIWQINAVVWDAAAWLPLTTGDGPACSGTGLSGDECWHSVFGQEMFTQLILEIMQRPASLVMLKLKCCKR